MRYSLIVHLILLIDSELTHFFYKHFSFIEIFLKKYKRDHMISTSYPFPRENIRIYALAFSYTIFY